MYIPTKRFTQGFRLSDHAILMPVRDQAGLVKKIQSSFIGFYRVKQTKGQGPEFHKKVTNALYPPAKYILHSF